MASWLDGIEDAAFKAVPGGYVFKSPSRWIYGRPKYYLVNDPQKAAIGELIREQSRFAMKFSILTVVGLLTLATVPLVFFGQYFGPFSTWLLAMAFFVPIAMVRHIYYVRMLRPIIKDLPKTDQRIPISSQLSKLACAMPKWLVYTGMVAALLIVFGGGVRMYELMSEGRLAGRWMSLVPGVTSGVILAGYFVYAAMLKNGSARTRKDLIRAR